MSKILRFINTIVATAVLAAPVVAVTGTVSATGADYTLTVPIETVITGAAGSTHKITAKTVDSIAHGMECSVNATSKNQHSVHPNSNLTVASGTSMVVLHDVERAGHVITQAKGTLTLGSDVAINVTLGEDKVFSGGMEVTVSCVEKEIEVCRDGIVTSIKQGDRASSDTDAPCPEETINVCRDGKVIVIKETDRKTSDTDAPCPAYINVCRDDAVVRILEEDKLNSDTAAPCVVREVSVCRDGKVITIAETDRKTSDTDAPCPEVLAAVLPNTGPGAVAAGVAGATFIGGTAAAQLRMRKRS